MRKTEQAIINAEVEQAINEAQQYLDSCTSNGVKLRSCSAWVYETSNYYFLKSYNTFVAFIDKRTDTLYDILRYVYGYTTTSAQHIAKFRNDYSVGLRGCTKTWREI